MGTFFVYSLKAGLCLAVFYLLYKLLLSKETFHAFNRRVIILIMLLSLAVPLVHITVDGTQYMANGIVQVEEMLMQTEVLTTENSHRGLTTPQVLFLIYIIGVVAFVASNVLSVARLRRLIGRGRVEQERGGMKLVVIDEDISPFSWFGYIVISSTDYRENARFIITHETAHVRRRHSVDILLCNILITFQWYNPAAWLLKQELQDIHEYEADSEVLRCGIDAKHYQLLLIRKAVGEKLFSMANNMNHNSLKKRITMMKTKQSNAWNRLKAAAVIPVAAITVVAFASPKAETAARTIEVESNDMVATVAQPLTEVAAKADIATNKNPVAAVSKNSNEAATAQDTISRKTVYSVVDEPPQFPGGMLALMTFLRDKTKYPAAAVKNKIQGSVIVQFIVNADGTINPPTVVKSIAPELDAEAKRVVTLMPKWQPGRKDGKAVNTKYTMPITFRLQPDKAAKTENTEQATSAEKKMVYVIDGNKSTEAEMRSLDPNKIKEIQVIKKGEDAVQKYGEEARDGAILITTKK